MLSNFYFHIIMIVIYLIFKVSSMTIEQAKRNRDAFAMSLYNHLFSFILTTINKSISNHKRSGSPSIGILDIFGFENFASNR